MLALYILSHIPSPTTTHFYFQTNKIENQHLSLEKSVWSVADLLVNITVPFFFYSCPNKDFSLVVSQVQLG